MYLSMVVPCFNEERGVQGLYDALVAALSGRVRDFEVVFVDDGSTDGTLPEMRGLAAADPRVRYLSLSRNFGKEAAMLCGLRHARGQRVALLDADLQHPPWLLPRMLALLDAGYDQVAARRIRSGETGLRACLSTVYHRVARRLLPVSVPDGAGDFRVLSRRAVDAVLSLPEQHRFSKGLFAWIGFTTAYLPYRDVRRELGRSRWRLGTLLDYGIDGFTAFSTKPLRGSLYLGAVVTLCCAGYLAYALLRTIVDGTGEPGYGPSSAGLLGLGGLHLVFLGVLGEYVGRCYAELKRRPHYLVQETSAQPSSGPGDRPLPSATEPAV